MDSQSRKPYRSDVTDEQWRFIKRFLPPPARTGCPRADVREVLNGILYVLITGCQWQDLPHDIQASPKTCHRQLLQWQRRRVWQKILRVLLKEAERRKLLNWKNAYHDASTIKSKGGTKAKLDSTENTVFWA